MTVSTTTSVVKFDGDGASTQFTFSYKVLGKDDVGVILTNTTGSTLDGIAAFSSQTLSLDSDYSISLADPGGSVDLSGGASPFGAPSTGIRVTLSRDTEFTQDIEYIPNGPFPAETHEEGLDRAALRDQELAAGFSRIVRLQEGDEPADVTLPLKAERSDKLFGFDSSGNPVATTASDENLTLSDISDSGVLAGKDTVASSDIDDNAVTEPKLNAADSPASGEVLSWNGSQLEWVTQSGSLDDESVTEPKLNAANTPGGGEVLSWNGSQLEWVTQASGGSAIALDLGDDGNNQSGDLTEIATVNDANSIVTEDAADKMLIDMSQNWPTADAAVSLNSNALDAIGEIDASLRSGVDATLVTGTSGAGGNLAEWNVDGDAVDSGQSTSGVTSHIGSTSNPHSVTASQVGLGNVPNEDATNPNNWDYTLTGVDTNVVTGTSGVDGNLLQWNADGDAVDSGVAASDVGSGGGGASKGFVVAMSLIF